MRSLPTLGSLAILLIGRASAQPPMEFQQALTGSWVGTLEYRDYAEPAESIKRVKLPTWLTVETDNKNLQFRYVYDDGPAKTVTETSLVHMDAEAARYSVVDKAGKSDESYSLQGLDKLKQGRGIVTLRGPGLENKVTVDVRTTIRIGRNILEITRETALPGQAFTFRHAYTFVRAEKPVVSAPH